MDRLTLKANEPVKLIKTIPDASYAVQPGDRNAVLGFTSASAVTVILPADLGQGFEVELLQMGTGVVTAQEEPGASMVSPQGSFFTAAQYASLACTVTANGSGAAAVWLVSSGGVGGQGGGSPVVTSYAAIRGTSFPPTTNALVLSDPYLGGTFVRATSPQRDDGGTSIIDASGQAWQRLIQTRINAQWFYSIPGRYLGDNSAYAITATDLINNPQWVGLPDGTGMYPVGTYMDYICLQEWLYACTAQASAPPATFQGSITGAVLNVTEWIAGPKTLSVGQPISGPNVPAGTSICLVEDPTHFGVGIPQGTGSIDHVTTPTCDFHCYITASYTMVVNQIFSGVLEIGQVVTSPPGGTLPFGAVLPGTTILQQTQQTFGDGPGGRGQYIVGVSAQDVPSATMNVVGGAIWNSQGSNYRKNRAGWCPNGAMHINQMLGCVGVGVDLEFEHRLSATISWHGTMGSQNVPAPWNLAGPAFIFNCFAYSGVKNLCVSDASTGCAGNLVVIDHDPNQQPYVAGSLSPQGNTFTDWFIGGNGPRSNCGLAIARSGGAAQGDTQNFIDLFVASTQDGVLIGGDNAVGVAFFGGNLTSCPGRGIKNAGGCFSSFNQLYEANPYNYFLYPQANQITLDGADIFSSEVGTENSYSVGTRSESIIAAFDPDGTTELHSFTMSQAAGFTPWQANAHQLPGYSVTAAGVGFSLAMCVDDGGPDWFIGTLDATGLVLTADPSTPSLPWTPNAWAGLGTWLRFGSNGGCASNGIASNTANTITLLKSYGTTYTYPLAYKIFQSGGPTQPNWAAVPATGFGKVNRFVGPGYGWTTKAGSNFVASIILPPAGAMVMIPRAQLFNLQSFGPGGTSPTDIGALFGLVGVSNPGAGGVNGSINNTTLTVNSLTSGTVQIGAVVNGAQPNTRVTQQISGPAGGAGTYAVDTPQMLPLSAGFTGQIVGPVLTIAGTVFYGTVNVGDFIASPNIRPNTQIIAQLSGTPGGGGGATYEVSVPQTVSEWMLTGPGGTASLALSTTGSFSIVSPFDGSPRPAGYTIQDGVGYWGQPISDGGVTWMPVDFDGVSGCKRVIGCQFQLGRAFRCGDVEVDGYPTPTLKNPSFIRDTTPWNSSSYRGYTTVTVAPVLQALSANPFNVGLGSPGYGVGVQKSLYFQVTVSATVNMPAMGANLEFDTDLIFDNWSSGVKTITWGTNVKAAAPTLATGNLSHQITIAHMKWVGSLFGGGFWLLTGVSGPM